MFFNLIFIFLSLFFFSRRLQKVIILFNFTLQLYFVFNFLCQFWSSLFYFFCPIAKLIFLYKFTFLLNINFIWYLNFDLHFFNCYFFKKKLYSSNHLFNFILSIFNWPGIELRGFFIYGALGLMTRVMGLKSFIILFIFYWVILILWSKLRVWHDTPGLDQP